MKAVGLISGGLDSILALKLIREQGIEVHAIYFSAPFISICGNEQHNAEKFSKECGAYFKVFNIGKDFYRVLRHPKHGYGRGVNPCIDCHIYMLKKARIYAKKIGGSFVFTGEVLDERPMSQYMKALMLIEKESSLKGKLLRPLSAKLLEPTIAEKRKWINGDALLDFRGRTRNRQIALAKKLNITNYPSPGGGCLLTERDFARRVKDFFAHNKKISNQDMSILKIGRHFRKGNNKFIVGKNEKQNSCLEKMKKPSDYIFHIPLLPSPVTLLQGKKNKDSIMVAAGLTLRYADTKEKKAEICYGKKLDKKILAKRLTESEIEEMRL